MSDSRWREGEKLIMQLADEILKKLSPCSYTGGNCKDYIQSIIDYSVEVLFRKRTGIFICF
jgi:hypothetical protein